jgi:hypothetical protein
MVYATRQGLRWPLFQFSSYVCSFTCLHVNAHAWKYVPMARNIRKHTHTCWGWFVPRMHQFFKWKMMFCMFSTSSYSKSIYYILQYDTHKYTYTHTIRRRCRPRTHALSTKRSHSWCRQARVARWLEYKHSKLHSWRGCAHWGVHRQARDRNLEQRCVSDSFLFVCEGLFGACACTACICLNIGKDRRVKAANIYAQGCMHAIHTHTHTHTHTHMRLVRYPFVATHTRLHIHSNSDSGQVTQASTSVHASSDMFSQLTRSFLSLPATSRGILAEVAATASAPRTFVVDQNGVMILDLSVR